MWRFIIVTFGFLAFAFYEMSGGADFDPEATRLARIDVPVTVEEEKLERVVDAAPAEQTLVPENVTRVSLNLNSVNDVLRPQRNVPTTPARQLPAAEEPVATDVALSEEEPTVILPSLIMDTAVITPVDFNAPDTAEESVQEVRQVSARSVNVRGGPGTNFSVVNRLTRGDAVEILQDPGNGWVKLRPVGGGIVGWMADFLLSEG
ncbi:SH3 domain-containing protein [Tateyamaria omphalii]|uniref:SH3 domain-containing protein n=1 Tax=Tateyamaria omphalii TaxID=299262 RepID=UPI001C9A2508|nr:SH3 domain-containing protein [Tateyamaria omphalii]MBY5934479.1 SH3 domain-containing protein [Tateyamaria omphalii]